MFNDKLTNLGPGMSAVSGACVQDLGKAGDHGS